MYLEVLEKLVPNVPVAVVEHLFEFVVFLTGLLLVLQPAVLEHAKVQLKLVLYRVASAKNFVIVVEGFAVAVAKQVAEF